MRITRIAVYKAHINALYMTIFYIS